MLILSAGAVAHDWRQFRGPNANSAEKSPELSPVLDLNGTVAWKSDLPGRGLSSPIIVGTRVFVTCSSGARQDRLHVICLNASDGSKRWERQFWATGRTMCHEKISVAAPTPTSDGLHVYALFSSNDLICLDLDGNLIWLRGLTRDYPNASNSLGMSSSPAFADGVLVAQIENDSESFAAGFDAANGTNRWKLNRPAGANWTSPVLWTKGVGGTLVALQSKTGITAVDAASGHVLWEFDAGAATIPSSAVSGGVMYVPSHGLVALRVEPDGGRPQQLWQSNQLRPSTPSPVVAGDKILVLNDAGVLTCAAAETGARLWQLRLKGPFTSTPVTAGSLAYCVNEKGLAQVVDVSKPDGEVVGEFDFGEVILCTPSIAAGALYVRSDGHLWKLRKG